MTDTTDVVAGWIGEEDVSAFVFALSVSLQPSTCRRQRSEVCVIFHGDQHVRIFCVRLVRRQGTDERDAPNAGANTSALDKA